MARWLWYVYGRLRVWNQYGDAAISTAEPPGIVFLTARAKRAHNGAMNVNEGIEMLGRRGFIALTVLQGELSNVDRPYAEIVARAFRLADEFVKVQEAAKYDGTS